MLDIRKRVKDAKPFIEQMRKGADEVEVWEMLAWTYNFVPVMWNSGLSTVTTGAQPALPTDIERMAQAAIVKGWPDEKTLHNVASCSAYRFDTEVTPPVSLVTTGLKQASEAKFDHCHSVDELRILLTLASSVRVFQTAQQLSVARKQPLVSANWAVKTINNTQETLRLAQNMANSYIYVVYQLLRIK